MGSFNIPGWCLLQAPWGIRPSCAAPSVSAGRLRAAAVGSVAVPPCFPGGGGRTSLMVLRGRFLRRLFSSEESALPASAPRSRSIPLGSGGRPPAVPPLCPFPLGVPVVCALWKPPELRESCPWELCAALGPGWVSPRSKRRHSAG